MSGPKISKFGHVTQATPTSGSFYDPDAVGVRLLCLCQILSGCLYSFQSYKGVQKFWNWSRDQGHSHFWVVLWSGRCRRRALCLFQIWSGYLYSFKSYKGIPKFRSSVTWPRPRPLTGHFMVRTPERFVLDVCTKFESDTSIRSKVIRVPKFGN